MDEIGNRILMSAALFLHGVSLCIFLSMVLNVDHRNGFFVILFIATQLTAMALGFFVLKWFLTIRTIYDGTEFITIQRRAE